MADTITQERLDEIIAETGVDEVTVMNILSYVGIRLEDPKAMRTIKSALIYS